MKIYCSTPADFDWQPYIGKDVWVKCAMPNGLSGYVRPLDFAGSYFPNLQFNWISDDTISDIQYHLKSASNIKGLNQVFSIPIDDIKVSDPVIHVSSEELLGYSPAENAPAIFNKLLGKPMWIKVIDSEGWRGAYYIKVTRNEGALFSGKKVGADLIDDYDPEGETELPSKLIKSFTGYSDRFDICEPKEMLSDDEILEGLAQADTLYQQYALEELAEDDE